MRYRFDLWIRLLLGVLIILATLSPLAANDKIPLRLQKMMEINEYGQPVKVWLYLKDKDSSPSDYQKAAGHFTPRAYQRRVDIPLDWYDLPVKNEYINAVKNIAGDDIIISRWLNAISVKLNKAQVEVLADEDFIIKIEPVAYAIRRPDPEILPPEYKPSIDSAEYGLSFRQNQMLGVDSLHKLGLNGEGVLLAFFDTGYLTTHQAFDSLDIINTWNFIDGNSYVSDMSDDQTGHGTATLSACGGFESGLLIGPAYKADYILAKTEIKNLEIRVEEDYWVAAAEWADSLGADIISSSLGYSDWYTYADMDGNTAATTIAADIAASRGILVVVSAGNEGTSVWHYIHAPADADSIITVGAVGYNEIIVPFSSYGPTYDDRLKPEMVAMGSGVLCANDQGGYYYKSGTSLSAPLISGGAALVLQAIPSLRGQPMKVRQRLIEASDRLANPDYRYGYGLPDMVLAAGYGLRILPKPMMTVNSGVDTVIDFQTLAPPDESVQFEAVDIPDGAEFADFGDGTASIRFRGEVNQAGISQYSIAAAAGVYFDTLQFSINTVLSSDLITVGPNPCTDSLRIFVSKYFPDGYKIEIFSLSGDLVYRTYQYSTPFTWPVTNQHGEKVASGVYIILFSADGIERKVKVYKM